MGRTTRSVGRRPFAIAAEALITHRRVLNVLLDGALWAIALLVAVAIRYDLRIPGHVVLPLVATAAVTIALQLAVGVADGLYLGRHGFGSFDEVLALTRTVGTTGGLVLVLDVPVRLVPLSSMIAAPFLALCWQGGARYAWRLALERRRRPTHATERLIVFGAGEGGTQIISNLVRERDGRYDPVALLDDDPRKQHLRIKGVPVRGTRSDLAAVAERAGATSVLIAIPSAPAALVREVSDQARKARLRVMVLPAATELLDGTVGIDDIRPLTEADLLGRREIDTDVAAIADYLYGKRVLVTGAGGSIGSELSRQLHAHQPDRLFLLDRDESALHAVQLSIEGRALLDSDDLILCDLRDTEQVAEVFERCRPEVVFHAAALKHLTLLQRNPREAVKTNVVVTRDLLDLASTHGVERFVNISTDKAAAPTSVLGTSKRLTERLTAAAGFAAGRDFLSVRFGNVLGSRGSVVPLFRQQIAAGGPITLTHPDITRYFMTIEEAVQLVIQAGAIGRGGEVLVLDMGEPVSIRDVALRLAAQADRQVAIEYTGLRPGEKLHEDLLAPDEEVTRVLHPLIRHVPVPPVDPGVVDELARLHDHAAIIEALAAAAGVEPRRTVDGDQPAIR